MVQVGIARATSDGVFSATIWDVSVLPAWQRSGLGRAMMERITCQLVEAGIPTITLYAEPSVVELYERLGERKYSAMHCLTTALSNNLYLSGVLIKLPKIYSGFVRDPDGVRGMAFQRQKKDKQYAVASSR